MQRARSDLDKDKRRSALLDAALEVFFDKGFAAARMDDIAKRAGVSKGSVYLYFDSKDALFESLVEQHAGDAVHQITAAMNAAPDFNTALDAIKTFAAGFIRESKVPRLIKILIGDCNHFPEAVRHYRETVIEKLLASLTMLVARRQDEGEIKQGDPALLARLVVAPALFAAIWTVVFETTGGDQLDISELFDAHIDNLKRGLFAAERPLLS